MSEKLMFVPSSMIVNNPKRNLLSNSKKHEIDQIAELRPSRIKKDQIYLPKKGRIQREHHITDVSEVIEPVS
jgi:hypothetical protein